MDHKKRFNTAELFSLQVKILRTTPVLLGTIKNFYLYGEHEGDTFATGGIIYCCFVVQFTLFLDIGYLSWHVTFDLYTISTYICISAFFPKKLGRKYEILCSIFLMYSVKFIVPRKHSIMIVWKCANKRCLRTNKLFEQQMSVLSNSISWLIARLRSSPVYALCWLKGLKKRFDIWEN